MPIEFIKKSTAVCSSDIILTGEKTNTKEIVVCVIYFILLSFIFVILKLFQS